MAINVAGAVSGVGQEVETGIARRRTVLRPIDIGALGSYSACVKSGIEGGWRLGELADPRVSAGSPGDRHRRRSA
jgi:hypothetical protein